MGTDILNEPLVVVAKELTNVSFSLFNQFTLSLTESISNRLLSSSSITCPITLKSTPAVTVVGMESNLMSVLPCIVMLTAVLLPVCRELPLASGSDKSSATRMSIS